MSQITSRTLKKVRRTNKRRTNKRRTNKKRTNKKRTNKKRTNKKRARSLSYAKRGGNDDSPDDELNNDSVINIKLTTVQNPMHPQTYTIGECAICLEDIDEGEFVTTECKHTFHPNCFIELCSRGINQKCPLCRKDISSECNQLREAFRIATEHQKPVSKKGKLGGG